MFEFLNGLEFVDTNVLVVAFVTKNAILLGLAYKMWKILVKHTKSKLDDEIAGAVGETIDSIGGKK